MLPAATNGNRGEKSPSRRLAGLGPSLVLVDRAEGCRPLDNVPAGGHLLAQRAEKNWLGLASLWRVARVCAGPDPAGSGGYIRVGYVRWAC